MFHGTLSLGWGAVTLLVIGGGCAIDTSIQLDSSTPTADSGTCVPSPEVCDGVDNDCNPATEDGSDQEGFGLPCDSDRDADLCQNGTLICRDGRPFCDETGPGAVEFCNNMDDDCDDKIDENIVDMMFFVDGDRDGFGGAIATACAPGPGLVSAGGDCDDGNGAVYPGATEVCDDGIDQDCSGTPDDSASCTCRRFDGPTLDYWVCRQAVDWQEARSACIARGAMLAAPGEAEIGFVFDAVSTVDEGRNYWVGLNEDRNGVWRWANGDGATPIWHGSEPSMDLCIGDLDVPIRCGELNRHRAANFNDTCCRNQNYYVCEF